VGIDYKEDAFVTLHFVNDSFKVLAAKRLNLTYPSSATFSRGNLGSPKPVSETAVSLAQQN